MSGAEPVILVLKLLPLTWQAADKWLSISRGLANWTAFPMWLKRTISALQDESVMYEMNLRCLLLPVRDDLEAEGYTLEGPNLSLFPDAVVQAKLRKVLPPDDYPWIMEKIDIICSTAEKILAIFSVDGEVKLLESGTVDYTVNKLQKSFSQELERLMDDLKNANQVLNKYTTIQERIVRSQPSAQKLTRHIETLHTQASMLYQGLKLNFQCSGADHCHECAIAVEWDKSSTAPVPAFRLLLTETTELKQLEWAIESLEAPQNVLSQQDKVSIPRQIDVLKKEITVREKHENLVKEAKKKPIAIAAVAATETVLNPKNDKVEKIWLKRQGEKLTKKSKNKISKRTDQRWNPLMNRWETFWPWKSRNSESTNGMAKTDEVLTTPPEPPSLPGPDVTTAQPRKTQQVRFADETAGGSLPPLFRPGTPKAAADSTSNLQELKVCDLMAGQLDQQASGYLPLGTDRIKFKVCQPCPDLLGPLGTSLHTLRKFSNETPKISDRLRMGSQLGLLLVSLGMSGWIPQRWSACNIAVLQSPAPAPKRGVTNTPYFSYLVLSEILALPLVSGLPSREFSKSTIFSFGVLILELLGNVKFEQTEHWKNTCNPGTSWGMDKVSGAMLWKQAAETTQPDFLTEAIERCIMSQFGKSPDLNDAGFWQEFIDLVVEPLERYVFSSAQALG